MVRLRMNLMKHSNPNNTEKHTAPIAIAMVMYTWSPSARPSQNMNIASTANKMNSQKYSLLVNRVLGLSGVVLCFCFFTIYYVCKY